MAHISIHIRMIFVATESGGLTMANEVRLIDYDAAIDRYYAEYEKQDICDGAQDRDWLKKCFDEAPTIDPESLRPEGRWVRDHTYQGKHKECYVCSVCNHWQKWSRKHENAEKMKYMRYCPFCGAKMEG